MIDFEYYAPSSLKDALSILDNSGSEAKVLAGGTDLIVQMKDSYARPKVIIDIKKIPERLVVYINSICDFKDNGRKPPVWRVAFC